jgi:DNA helicase HerA-like ATPase
VGKHGEVGSLKPIGVVVSGSSPVNVPIQVYKGCENLVQEDSFVLIKDHEKNVEYFGVIRSLRMNDPLLIPHQRSSVIDNRELARHGKEVVFETSSIRVLGVLMPDGQLTPPRQPPTPRSEVYLIETPSDVNLKLETGLTLGKHKFSGIEVPLKPDALKYHIGVVGATGTGKSRLVVGLVNEVLSKTDWRVIVFDHSGLDYVSFFKSNVVNGDEVVLHPDSIFAYLKRELSVKDLAEDALSLAIYTYIALGGDVKNIQINIAQISEKLKIADLEELTASTKWDLSSFTSIYTALLNKLNARESTIEKLSALLTLQKQFIESLNKKKITSREILGRAEKEKLVVVDLSTVKQEERRYVVASILARIWEFIDAERKFVNTLVVIDEAHNYACQQGCWPSNELIERTAREGRKWGLGLVLASQRIIDFSTDIRNNINTFFFSKLQTPGDLENLAGVLDLGGIEYDDIAILATREFYFAGLGNPLKYPVLIEVKQV